jgi:two-component system response regulator AdeR
MSPVGDPVVLVVVDDHEVATRYRDQLPTDYTVRVATAGEDGPARLDDRVDVVLLDRETPDVSVTDTLSSVRERDLDCRVAIVTPVEPDVDVLELGFDAYITKPVTASTLSETVERLLERSRYDRLLRDYYAAVAEQATLEATASQAAPEESAEYRRLQADIEAMRAELADTMGGVSDDEDFIATIRRLSER